MTVASFMVLQEQEEQSKQTYRLAGDVTHLHSPNSQGKDRWISDSKVSLVYTASFRPPGAI